MSSVLFVVLLKYLLRSIPNQSLQAKSSNVQSSTAGPLARSVEDAAYLLNAMVGVDEVDVATLLARGHIQEDYTKFVNPAGLQGKRLGFVSQMSDRYSEAQLEIFERVKGEMKDHGAEIVEIHDIQVLRS